MSQLLRFIHVKSILAVLALVGLFLGSLLIHASDTGTTGDKQIAEAFAKKLSNLQVQGTGTVIKVLPDDREEIPHQRFLLQLTSGQKLLIAHNIGLASRIPDLKDGDRVEFNGEYEWNPKGGVIHWTHLDPAGRHTAGWLKHKDSTYQ